MHQLFLYKQLSVWRCELKESRSLHEGPHRDLEFLALHVVELRLDRLPDLQLVLDRRHLQPPLDHLLPVHVREPGVLADRFRVLLETQPLLGVLGEELLNEVLEELGGVLGEADDALAHELVEFLLGIGVVGGTARVEFVEDDAVLVPVGHAGVALLVDDLEGEVGGGAAEGLVDRVEVVRLLGEAEVRDERVAVLVQHDVLGLQVAVDDVVLVQRLHAQQDLAGVVPHLLLRELLPLLQQSREVAALAVVHGEEEVGLGLEGVPEADDEGVVEQAEDVLLGLDVAVEIGAEDALLPDGLECVELRFLVLPDEVDLPEGALPDLLVELEGGERDGLDLLVLADELVELEDVLLPPELRVPLLLLLLTRHHLLVVLVLQHLLDHRAVVRPVLVHLVLLLFLCLLVLLEEVGELSRGQIHRSHPRAVFHEAGGSVVEQRFYDFPLAEFSCVVESCTLILVGFVNADPRRDEEEAVLEFVGLGGDVERRFFEVGECVDVDAGIVDESADDLDGGVHGCVVDGRPVALVAVVDVDGQLRGLLLEELQEVEGLVLDDRLQEALVQLIQLLPVVVPDRLLHARPIPTALPDLLAQEGLLVGIAELLVDVFLVVCIFVGGAGDEEGLLEGVLDLLVDVHEATVDDLALGPVHDDQLALLSVVLVLDDRVDVGLDLVDDALAQLADRHLRTRLQRVFVRLVGEQRRGTVSHLIINQLSTNSGRRRIGNKPVNDWKQSVEDLLSQPGRMRANRKKGKENINKTGSPVLPCNYCNLQSTCCSQCQTFLPIDRSGERHLHPLPNPRPPKAKCSSVAG